MAPELKKKKIPESETVLELQANILEYCKLAPKGVPQKTLIEHLNVEPVNVANAINALLKKRQIEIHMKNKDIIILWKNNEGSKIKIEGDNEKKVIYQYIELAGNKGIIGQKLAKTCKLVLKNVNVILKDLEKEGLIKSVKSVAEKNRKVYMLYNLEPDIAVTGGTFYNNTEFDQEYVDILNQLFHKYLNQKLIRAKAGDKNPLVQRQFASATADEVITHISKLGISKEKLTIKDAELILNTLVYDGKVEKIGKVGAVGQTTSNSLITYLAVEGLVTSVGVLESPCGLCPVITKCSINGIISPSTCTYLKEWLQF